MSDYTPTTEQVRTEWVESANGSETNRLHSRAAFDRWLKAHDRAIAASAWDECLDTIEQYEVNTEQVRAGCPYRGQDAQARINAMHDPRSQHGIPITFPLGGGTND